MRTLILALALLAGCGGGGDAPVFVDPKGGPCARYADGDWRTIEPAPTCADAWTVRGTLERTDYSPGGWYLPSQAGGSHASPHWSLTADLWSITDTRGYPNALHWGSFINRPMNEPLGDQVLTVEWEAKPLEGQARITLGVVLYPVVGPDLYVEVVLDRSPAYDLHPDVRIDRTWPAGIYWHAPAIADWISVGPGRVSVPLRALAERHTWPVSLAGATLGGWYFGTEHFGQGRAGVRLISYSLTP